MTGEAKIEIENKYYCPIKLWKKFTDKQKVIYNNIRSNRMDTMVHPKMLITKEQWDTVSHNFACMAAWEL